MVQVCWNYPHSPQDPPWLKSYSPHVSMGILGSGLMEVRKRTIWLAIFSGDIPWNLGLTFFGLQKMESVPPIKSVPLVPVAWPLLRKKSMNSPGWIRSPPIKSGPSLGRPHSERGLGMAWVPLPDVAVPWEKLGKTGLGEWDPGEIHQKNNSRSSENPIEGHHMDTWRKKHRPYIYHIYHIYDIYIYIYHIYINI